MTATTEMTNDELQTGQVFETVFESNPKQASAYRFRATRLDGGRAPKVVLCNDARVQPGRPCRVRIASVKKPGSRDRGFIEVEFLSQIGFRLDERHYVDPLVALKLQALLERGLNILLDGPQGSGKTVLAQSIGRAMGVEYIFFNCSPVYEATDFLATLQIRATESGQPETIWIPTDVYRALTAAHEHPERRYLVFLDEFNRCREMARNGIMPALDSTRRLYNPLTGSTLAIPDNVLWIAAINNGAQFTGTTSVDPAQLDRFAPIKVDYPPADAEMRLLCERYPRVEQSQVERVVKAANSVRADKNLRLDLSMRATEEVCLMLEHPNFVEFNGDAATELMKTSFCGRFQGRWDDPSTDAGLVWQVIIRALEL